MCNLDECDYQDLIKLAREVDDRLKYFRPIKLTKVYKRCGKDGCPCAKGPSDGSWGNLHGPYVYARYYDRKRLKNRSISLGRYFDQDDIDEVFELTVNWNKYFNKSATCRAKMTEAEKAKYRSYISLSAYEFKLFYGIDMTEDRLGRDNVWYATDAKKDAYKAAVSALTERQNAANNELAYDYGIGGPVSQLILLNLLKNGYYIDE